MDTIVQDLRYGIRQLVKNPGFTTIAVVTLALGIGINATMFSMVSAILLRRPPGRDPDRVAVVAAINPAAGFQADISTVSAPNYLAWKEGNHVFSEMGAADEYRSASLTAQSESEVVPAAAVSANYFNVLGVGAQMGRTFRDGEDQSGQDHVVILSHQVWERRFGSDPAVVGRVIRLNRENYMVIGVMPANFRLLGFPTDLWMPLVLTPADQTAAARKERSLFLFARMKPEATLEQARAEFATLAHRAEQDFPDSEKGWGAKVRTLPDFLVYGFGIRGGLAVIMTTVGFVLLIACANVSGLLLARAAARRKELAIRFSLGAARLRIIRQLLTEGMVIALAGGGLGLLLARWGIALVRVNMTFNEAVNALDLGLDSNVVVFSTAISVACALLCALAPALKASRTDVATNLKDESRTASAGSSRSRLRKVMVTGEIALALFLLVGTGLLFVTMFRIEHQKLGFQPDHLLTAGITLDDARYKDHSHQEAFVRDLLPRLRQIPSAELIAVTSDLPATGLGAVNIRIQGQPEVPASQVLTAFDTVVTPEYFRTAGISLLKGRQFSDQDNAAAPRVVVVNQKFVDRYLNGEEALGKQIQAEVGGAPAGWSQIIGVVNNVKTYSEATAEDPGVYEAFLQRPVSSFSVMVRSTTEPNNLIADMRSSVAQVDAELPLARLMSMSAIIDRQKGGDQFFTRTLAGFAFMALLLAAIGIYGLIAYSVGQRTYEIGIRMAMGARSQDVLRMIFREGMRMAAIGAAIGLAMSAPLPKVFRAMFFDLHVNEPRLYFLVPLAVLAVAVLATYIPARRAARLDPMNALRQE
ncbi:MAG TPA: ABC transporter permease [Candidatus Dormibacteraeota bacterium]|nr:ABC transporter permease [Candidatus Dormibacteraeota bacterium]